MKTITDALERIANKSKATIDKRYDGNKADFIKKTLIGAMLFIGKDWKKDEIRRIYFNKYNAFYSFESDSIESIDGGEIDFAGYESEILKMLDDE